MVERGCGAGGEGRRRRRRMRMKVGEQNRSAAEFYTQPARLTLIVRLARFTLSSSTQSPPSRIEGYVSRAGHDPSLRASCPTAHACRARRKRDIQMISSERIARAEQRDGCRRRYQQQSARRKRLSASASMSNPPCPALAQRQQQQRTTVARDGSRDVQRGESSEPKEHGKLWQLPIDSVTHGKFIQVAHGWNRNEMQTASSGPSHVALWRSD